MNEPEHFADMLDDCPKCPRQSNPITTEGGMWPSSIRETLGCASIMLLPMPDGSFVLSGSQDLTSDPLGYTQPDVQLVWDMTVPAPTYFPPNVNRGLWALYNSIGVLLSHYMDGHDDLPEPPAVVSDNARSASDEGPAAA